MDIKCPSHKPQIYPSGLRFYFSLDSVLLGGVSGSLLSFFCRRRLYCVSGFLPRELPVSFRESFLFPSQRASCFLLSLSGYYALATNIGKELLLWSSVL
jgi:hypothetical protein